MFHSDEFILHTITLASITVFIDTVALTHSMTVFNDFLITLYWHDLH